MRERRSQRREAQKRGDYVLLQVSDVNGKFEALGLHNQVVSRRLLRGLAVRARQQCLRETALFRHVSLGLRLKRSEARTSAIEIIPLGSLDRRVIYQTKSRLDSRASPAPATPCFREDGRLGYFGSRRTPTLIWWATECR
jgi:hypothetical protein